LYESLSVEKVKGIPRK